MSWLQLFHDEHTALYFILPKFEGNLKDIEHGEAGENVIWELREFAEIIKDVLIPHFREEEKNVYPRAVQAGEAGKAFITAMYEEHNLLYEAFEGFLRSLGQVTGLGMLPTAKDHVARMISLSKNIEKKETPKNLDKLTLPPPLEVDRESVLKHGYAIANLLAEHIGKEENVLPKFLKND
ncbi:hemerythrin domain-containing protein [Pelotomaculum propionicicum]|uniref:Hemerythrin-like domain-containing protein n=1 Tax=Pelotomaculum propionicicum TaxID=258475 RepID=A0A4Y7RRX3_9FIRM|nr:hemerythrin domain-containing protein [Pelotomaculum propionicicum]NLI12771.1 hemerythrin domain-containing protein [Peptococcaceae bacterium]TEB11591.1 hypothetical protein Pmgp_01610 [Pelotomaculum propionicicum]